MTITDYYVGQPAACYIGGDAYPEIVTAIFPNKKGVVKRVAVRHISYRFDRDTQQYVYFLPTAPLVYDPEQDLMVTLRKNGRWIAVGDSLQSACIHHFGKMEVKVNPHL